MTYEKTVLANAPIFATIRMTFFDGGKPICSVNVVRNKQTNEFYYPLYRSSDPVEADACFDHVVDALEKKYHITILPIYYEEVESFYCDFNIDGIWCRLIFDEASLQLSLTDPPDYGQPGHQPTPGGPTAEQVLDAIAVHIVQAMTGYLAQNQQGQHM